MKEGLSIKVKTFQEARKENIRFKIAIQNSDSCPPQMAFLLK
jgi:hypothetical protein